MIAKLMTTASDNDPAVMFRKVMVALPASIELIQQLYAPAVALALATFTITTSLALRSEFVKVKVTLVVAASDALFIVI